MKNRIAALRHERKLSLAQLAGLVGTTKAQIQKLECGHRRLSVGWMERIARALDIKMSDLLPTEQVACQHSTVESALLGVVAQLPEDDQIILIRIAQELLSTPKKTGKRKAQFRENLASLVDLPASGRTAASQKRRS